MTPPEAVIQEVQPLPFRVVGFDLATMWIAVRMVSGYSFFGGLCVAR